MPLLAIAPVMKPPATAAAAAAAAPPAPAVPAALVECLCDEYAGILDVSSETRNVDFLAVQGCFVGRPNALLGLRCWVPALAKVTC